MRKDGVWKDDSETIPSESETLILLQVTKTVGIQRTNYS